MDDDARPAGGEVARAGAPGSDPPAELDLRGEVCPYTFLKARLALETLPAGAVLRVLLDNEASARDVPRSLASAGHVVLGCAPAGDRIWALLARRSAP
jgi:TusA-related sulfurtransferase